MNTDRLIDVTATSLSQDKVRLVAIQERLWVEEEN